MKKTLTGAKNALIIGFNGGVGRATISLLQQSTTGKKLSKTYNNIFLLDKNADVQPVNNSLFKTLPATRVDGPEILKNIIREYNIDQVIDLASLNTEDCARACEELGADFFCTSVEEWPGQESVPTDTVISKFLNKERLGLKKQSHLIGSGANPGIVNALTFAAMEAFAKKVDAPATATGLDLQSIFITEEDSTREPEVTYDGMVFPMTWSPLHCLEELFEPRSFVAYNKEVRDLGHAPTDKLYSVRCGDRIIKGFAVPHEETRTLAEKIPDVEIAFIYRVPESARRALKNRPTARKLEDWHPFTVIPPRITKISGTDRLGVLLSSRKYGELWLGFDTDVAKGLELGTNATQLQVAAGVVAGLEQLGNKKGIHFVEELNWEKYLEAIYSVLGKPQVVYNPSAEPLTLTERGTQPQLTKEYALTV